MIIDAHNHVWPDKLAARALDASVPDLELFGDGTVAALTAAQADAGVDLSVCLAVANTPSQLDSANAFIGALDRNRFVPFGTIHPALAPEVNVAALRLNDVRGVKIHPVYQRFRLDDRRLYDVLAALEGEWPVIVHVGTDAMGEPSPCTPPMLADIAATFPLLELIACHLGGYHMLPDAVASVVGTSVYIDTAWPPSIADLDPATVRDIIRRHGCERVVFSSDWPAASPAREVQAIRRLGLTDEETNAVLGGNMGRLLGLESNDHQAPVC